MSDTISRQAAIDAIDRYYKDKRYITRSRTILSAICRDMKSTMDSLPSAQPEQRWIPCDERLPEEPYGCLVTVWDTDPITMDEFENILPYFVGWDGEQWNDADGEQCPFEVIAWMPLPEPWEGVGR